MNLKTGDQAMFSGEKVTIQSLHIHITSGRKTYLIEHPDNTFSRVGESALLPLGAPKMRSVAASLSGFFRAPAKRRIMLK